MFFIQLAVKQASFDHFSNKKHQPQRRMCVLKHERHSLLDGLMSKLLHKFWLEFKMDNKFFSKLPVLNKLCDVNECFFSRSYSLRLQFVALLLLCSLCY